LRVIQVFLAPVQILTTGFIYYAVPELAQRSRRTWRAIRRTLLAPPLLAVVLTPPLLVLYAALAPLLFSELPPTTLIWPVVAAVWASALGVGGVSALRSIQKTGGLLVARLASAILTLGLLFPMMAKWNEAGAAWALALGSAVFSLVVLSQVILDVGKNWHRD
jgi:hypothetical protein